ncbi:TerB family tellurite resistance protein [Motilimonas sp. 1_MG-2023]|uniref:tellurite resistance TerB family protein n=1 Tax=Motilimonas sp. 1_MG-2023 TaxID=3062672 RepID=UPI0026E40DD4|nr:TerB family tellurite resistance protein [Motilimonas sp. 1_MG-2023]MDO6526604.1 TerB family tellurite resistance protein [Motilimonas sp. 1_MG-2023]
MIAALKSFFADLQIEEKPDRIEIELAVAVLLTEVGQADSQMSTAEQDKIEHMLVKAFGLSDEEAKALLLKAQQQQDKSVSMQTFTSVLKEQLSYEQRVRFVKGMWLVAYADNQLDPYEDYIIRKIADLLYLKHSDFIQTKLSAESQSK